MGKMGENWEKQRAENVALDFLLDWGRQLPELIEVRERRRERLKAALNESRLTGTRQPLGAKASPSKRDWNCCCTRPSGNGLSPTVSSLGEVDGHIAFG